MVQYVQYKYKRVQILKLSASNETLYYFYDVNNLSPETDMEMQIPVWNYIELDIAVPLCKMYIKS